mmetsp:Transcript_5285/g.14178  ORF Transcript_5285/g.14178 Transcript_5285/m.14178 type:complete len:129 (-) Transcript_5285:347-733(-)
MPQGNAINKKRVRFEKKRKDIRRNVRRAKLAEHMRRDAALKAAAEVAAGMDVDEVDRSAAVARKVERDIEAAAARLKHRKPRGLSGKKTRRIEKASARALKKRTQASQEGFPNSKPVKVKGAMDVEVL